VQFDTNPGGNLGKMIHIRDRKQFPDTELVGHPQLYCFREGSLELADPDVLKLVEDRNGGLWLANQLRPVLQYVRGGKKVVYDTRQGLPPQMATGMSQDSSGTLWVSSSGGSLCRFRN